MIRRSEQYNSDYMSREMDERLEQLEERLTALYANATLETQSDFYDFMEKYKKDYLAMLDKLDAEKITKAEFDLWCSKKILKTTQYKEMLATLTNILVNTDVAAMAIIRGKLPFVVAQSYNFAQSLGFAAADKAGLSVGTFQVYNAWSVQKIIKDNPRLLPKVDIPLDKQWNQDKINTAITHSIIHGDSIPKVAKRLREVTNMDKNSAIRNARTSMTGAENLGRNESIKFMKKNGVPVQLMWSATHDSRTRDTHLLLDRTFQNEKGYFGEGILGKLMRYPGDPEGLPQEIYNCRCRASIYLEGIDHSKDAELYDKFMTENYPDDYRQLKEWEEKTGRAEERRQTLEYQKVLKEIHKTGYYDPKKLEEAQQRAREATERIEARRQPRLGEDKDVTQTAEDILGNAYENHRIDNELRSTPLEEMKGSPLSSVSASYDHLSDETAEKINEALTKLTNDYDTPLCRIRTMDSSEALGNKAYATTIHNYSTDTAEIILNPMKMGNYNQMTERVMELVNKGYAAQISPENAGEYIITHEFGHSILNMRDTLSNSQNWVDADFDKIRSARKEINNIYEEYISVVGQLESERKSLELEVIMGTAGDDTAEKARELGKELLETKISNYSLVNVDEFLAESFANERLGVNSNPYSERAVKVLDKYFRR